MKNKITHATRHPSSGFRPFVSVIIPVYNGAPFLEESIESIQQSTYRNFEVLLVDDGSRDESKKLCRALAKRYSNVRFFAFAQNRGMDFALNFALKKARGSLICRLNQDDKMMPNRIETQVAYLNDHPEVVAVGSSIMLFDEKGHLGIIEYLPKDRDIRNTWLLVSPFADPAVMYRKHAAMKAGGYDQNYWPADDVHLWYRMAQVGKLANIQIPLTLFRVHDHSGSMVFFRQQIRNTWRVHRFAHETITRAPWSVQLYWLCQLVAGMLLPAKFNYMIYRGIKTAINTYKKASLRVDTAFTKKKTVKKVKVHPAKLRISGV